MPPGHGEIQRPRPTRRRRARGREGGRRCAPFGFSLGLGGRAGKANAAFTPASLALTGWWRISFSGSPWVGVASAGTSGSNNLTEATNPPTATGTLNSLTLADFDGTNDQLGGGAFTTYYDADGYSGWALVFVDTITTNSGSSFLNDAIVADTGGIHEIFLTDNGAGTVNVGISHYNGTTFPTAQATFATGAWKLVQWKFDGTNIKIRVNNGAWSSTAAGGNLDASGANLRVSGNYNATVFTDQKFAEIGLADLVLSDADFENIRAYTNTRYALSL